MYWAERFKCPILSTDSRQCYSELAIGAAPPSKEELAAVDHYFVADRSITEPVTAGEFEHFGIATLTELFKSHDVVVAVGGSGMYIDALLHGLDPLPSDPEVKAQLISNTEAAVAKGCFGAPTMFLDDQMFFGQDRIQFIEMALQ